MLFGFVVGVVGCWSVCVAAALGWRNSVLVGRVGLDVLCIWVHWGGVRFAFVMSLLLVGLVHWVVAS